MFNSEGEGRMSGLSGLRPGTEVTSDDDIQLGVVWYLVVVGHG
jgi:hypothetical protein